MSKTDEPAFRTSSQGKVVIRSRKRRSRRSSRRPPTHQPTSVEAPSASAAPRRCVPETPRPAGGLCAPRRGPETVVLSGEATLDFHQKSVPLRHCVRRRRRPQYRVHYHDQVLQKTSRSATAHSPAVCAVTSNSGTPMLAWWQQRVRRAPANARSAPQAFRVERPLVHCRAPRMLGGKDVTNAL